MKQLIATTTLIAFALSARGYSNELCTHWQTSEQLGELDRNFLSEASGIAVSQISPNRLFHVNDSGDGPYIYISTKSGSQLQRIRIAGFSLAYNPTDIEDLAYGECPKGLCLVVGDIGDNLKIRESLTLIFIKDQIEISDSVSPEATIRLIYPDGPHDAESLIMHPNGDILVVTKALHLDDSTSIYRIRKTDWQSYPAELVLEKLTTINVGQLLESYLERPADNWEKMITSADISRDGNNLLLLTYFNAIEVLIDPDAGYISPNIPLEMGVDYQVIELTTLDQQEAITYDGLNKLLYHSEQANINSPLMRTICAANPT